MNTETDVPATQATEQPNGRRRITFFAVEAFPGGLGPWITVMVNRDHKHGHAYNRPSLPSFLRAMRAMRAFGRDIIAQRVTDAEALERR